MPLKYICMCMYESREHEMRAQQQPLMRNIAMMKKNTKFSFLSIKMRPICTKNANAQDLILIAAVTVVVVGGDAVSATTVTAVSSCNCRSHLGTIVHTRSISSFRIIKCTNGIKCEDSN